MEVGDNNLAEVDLEKPTPSVAFNKILERDLFLEFGKLAQIKKDIDQIDVKPSQKRKNEVTYQEEHYDLIYENPDVVLIP